MLPHQWDSIRAAVRHRAAVELRRRVAGEDAQRRADGIWGKSGERWFTAQDPIWRVHMDASMFVGGIRALLLQSLHPLAMAGVDEHSSYRDDPWGRLQQTSYFISTTTFGTVPDAERLLAKIRGIHRRVRGTFDGVPYRADDPALLTWVHAAEADSFLTAYQSFGAAPLSPAQADTYVAQISSVSGRLGFADAPTTVAELRRTLASYRPQLRCTPAASAALRFIVREPPLSLAARPGYLMLVAGAIGTLPPYARDLLGIRLPPGGTRTLRAVGGVGARGVRWLLADPQVQADRRVNQAAQAPGTP